MIREGLLDTPDDYSGIELPEAGVIKSMPTRLTIATCVVSTVLRTKWRHHRNRMLPPYETGRVTGLVDCQKRKPP